MAFVVRLANTGVVRARWSDAILDECFRNILENRPDLKPEALERTRELMTRAVPDCMVTGFDGLIDGLVLPDPDDRHVLAAAIRAGAQAIVTFNLDDFPTDRLERYNVEAKHPDDFVIDTIDLSPGAVAKVLAEQAAALKNPPAPSRSCWIRCATKDSSAPSRSCGNCSRSVICDESDHRSCVLRGVRAGRLRDNARRALAAARTAAMRLPRVAAHAAVRAQQ